VVAVAALVVSVLCLLPAHRFVDYLSDDAYYYFKVARFIAAGQGPTFDGLTVTTGFHPLYMFVLVGLEKLSRGEFDLVRVALVFNSACFLLTGWVLRLTARRMWGNTAGTWAAIFWYANPHALILVATGMEGSLYALSLAVFFAALFRRCDASPRGYGLASTMVLGGLCGMCVVARTDALLLVALVAVGIILLPSVCAGVGPDVQGEGRDKTARRRAWGEAIGKAALFGVVALLPFALWLVYAERHTGALIQVSAEIKQWRRHLATADMDMFQRFWFSAEIFMTWVVKSVVKIPALKYLVVFASALPAALVASTSRKALPALRIVCLFPLLLGLVYSVTLIKTWTWYYAPVLVALTLIAAGCMAIALHATLTGRRHAYARRWLPLCLALAAMESAGYLVLKGVRGRNSNQEDMHAVALWIRNHLPADATVAAWNAGIYGWHSGHAVINLDGLINNEIIGVLKAQGSLGDYLVRREVDYVVDQADYMAKRIPEWGREDYQLVYRHESGRTDPIAVWKINRREPEGVKREGRGIQRPSHSSPYP
jgi:hypothetical protein